MSEVNKDWVNEQFAKAKIKVGIGKAVFKLLDTWSELNLTPENGKQVLAVLSKVALGHAIVPENKDEIWAPGLPGKLKVGLTVRVLADAFNGAEGQLHNGRVGTVVAVRSGDIIVNSTDGITPKIEGYHYRPQQLEVRIK